MKKELNLIDKLPLLKKEKEELVAAVNRRDLQHWVQAREDINILGEERKEKLKEVAIQRLLGDGKVYVIVPIPDILKEYATELRSMGYSCEAISKGFKGSISTTWVIENLDNPYLRPRGQVIELLDDFERDFDLKQWLLLGSYNTHHNSKLTKKEIQKIKDLYSQGFSIGRIAEITKRSPSAVRRWVKK